MLQEGSGRTFQQADHDGALTTRVNVSIPRTVGESQPADSPDPLWTLPSWASGVWGFGWVYFPPTLIQVTLVSHLDHGSGLQIWLPKSNLNPLQPISFWSTISLKWEFNRVFPNKHTQTFTFLLLGWRPKSLWGFVLGCLAGFSPHSLFFSHADLCWVIKSYPVLRMCYFSAWHAHSLIYAWWVLLCSSAAPVVFSHCTQLFLPSVIDWLIFQLYWDIIDK